MSNSISQEQKNIFAHNLNKLLSENGKTQSDLVTYLGITASTVSDWCNAKKYPRVDKMQMLADYFGIKKSDLTEQQRTLDEILEEYKNILKDMAKENISISRVLPVYRKVTINNNDISCDGFVQNTFVDNLENFENHIALLIPNDDMQPEFSPQDIAIIHKQNNLENNRYFYLLIHEQQATIRKVTLHENKEHIVLKADNPDLDIVILPITDIKVVGKVIFIQKNKQL